MLIGYIFKLKKIYCEKDKKEGTGVYRRITTYIYSYENGEKICNCGYCRFDICDNQCKVFINVKVPDRYTMGIAEIYLLTRDEISGKLTKEMLGKTGGLNGSICYRQICDRNHMAGNIGMDNIKGVLIYNGESLKRAFYCNLKDEEPDILSLEESDGNINVSIFADREEEEDYEDIICDYNVGEDNTCENNDWTDNDNTGIDGADDGSIDNGSMNNCSIDNDSTDNVCKDIRENSLLNECAKNNDTVADDAGINNDTGEICVQYADIVDWEHNGNDKKAEKQNDKENDNINEAKWQELLFSKFPKVRINFGGEDSEAIKMRPHDLVWFPRKYWRFSNNRCLLNGYYNYRYIMLVKGMGEREGNYYLAVPGKNMVNEAISARKQGFSEFVRSKGDLGFWCCKVGQ